MAGHNSGYSAGGAERNGKMSTVKWKIKEHYVAGEFAGYVVVTDDKYEDVVCRGIGVDYRDAAVLIASAPELKAECDQLREALKEVLNCEVVTDTGDYSKGGTGFDCNEVKEIIRDALKGTEE